MTRIKITQSADRNPEPNWTHTNKNNPIALKHFFNFYKIDSQSEATNRTNPFDSDERTIYSP